jgi:nucleoside-diphosphate-sugar epimerase
MNWDCVYHVAAAGVSPAQREPQRLIDGNLGLLTQVLLGLAGRPPRRFVYTGTCAEYSRAAWGQLIAEDHPTRPVNPYGAAKAAAGIWGASLAQSLNIPFILARPFHFYGPGEGASRLIPYLVQRLRDGAAAELTGGEQMRDLLFVDDVADALITIGAAPACAGSVYNVCSGTGISIREVGEMAARVTGRPASLLHFGALPYRADEEMWIVGDNSRLRADFGWTPQTSLEQGVARLAGVPQVLIGSSVSS